MQLEHWRDRIDDLDAALIQLLNLRATFALEAGRLKQASGAPVRVPSREDAILARLHKLNRGPFDAEAVTKLYRVIFAESVRLQRAAMSASLCIEAESDTQERRDAVPALRPRELQKVLAGV